MPKLVESSVDVDTFGNSSELYTASQSRRDKACGSCPKHRHVTFGVIDLSVRHSYHHSLNEVDFLPIEV